MIRQKKYITGDYMEIEVFNMSNRVKPFKREKKMKESSSAQKNLNNKKSQRYFIRKAHLNFNKKDLAIDLTYDNAYLPSTKRGVRRDVKNYFKRLKRIRAKLGLKKKLKYMYVISNMDNMDNKVRFHVHMIINNMDRDAAEECWHFGTANTDRLKFNEFGITGKLLYMANQAKGERSWGCSNNLINPEPLVSDRKINARLKDKMELNCDDAKLFEKLYPGWIFTDCVVERDDEANRLSMGNRLYIRMRKVDFKKPKPKEKPLPQYTEEQLDLFGTRSA